MSFKCDYCGDTAPKNTVCTLVPVEFREVSTSFGTIDTQIVKELRRCVNCSPRDIMVDGKRMTLTPGIRITFTPPTAPARPGVARFDRE